MAGYIGSKSSVVLNAGATAEQGALADTAVQPNDSVTLGAVTATSFVGDGSGLTNLPASGFYEKIVSGAISASTSLIVFNNLDFANYNYRLILSGLQANNGDTFFRIQLSSNNGQSYATNGYSLVYMEQAANAAGITTYGSNNNSDALLTGNAYYNYDYAGVSGVVDLIGANDSDVAINWHVHSDYLYSSHTMGTCMRPGQASNAFKLYTSGQAMNAGKYALLRGPKT